MERGWCIAEDVFEALKAGHKETLYTLGNGYLGVRGAPEEGHRVATTATFIAGVFDAAAGAVPELVVAPNWLGMRIFVGGEEFSMEAGEILEFRRVLDMRDGVLERTVRWKDACGRVTRFTWRRIVSMADMHAAAISLSIVAEDHDSEIAVYAFIDGNVSNARTVHLDVVGRGWSEESRAVPAEFRRDTGSVPWRRAAQLPLPGSGTPRGASGQPEWGAPGEQGCNEAGGADDTSRAGTGGEQCAVFGPWYLVTRTRNSGIVIAEAAALAVHGADEIVILDRAPGGGADAGLPGGTAEVGARASSCGKVAGAVLKLRCRRGEPVVIEKYAGFGTSLDTDADALSIAVGAARRGAVCRFEGLLEEHRRVWHEIWDRCDIVIEGDDYAQQAVRFAIFQMVQAAPRHTDRVSIGARGLSGEGYRGHVFWDTETFVVPFFTYTLPEVARNLLGYRYHTLGAARKNAASKGFRGAMYAWESADTGEETTPAWGDPHPVTGERRRILCGDLEHHITADVAFAVWQYYIVTGDEEFLTERGAEILLETGRFWASRASYNASEGVYEILHVIGPDEYHEDVNNNFFTNVMARWNIRAALAVADYLMACHPSEWADLAYRIGVNPDELAFMAQVADGLVCGRFLHEPQIDGDGSTLAAGRTLERMPGEPGPRCGGTEVGSPLESAEPGLQPGDPQDDLPRAPQSSLRCGHEALSSWEVQARRLGLGPGPVLEQFDGFGNLLDVDVSAYGARSKPMEAVLGTEVVHRSKVVKQPDVLMALYLLGDDVLSQVCRLTRQSGPEQEWSRERMEEVLRANWYYYEPRTDHGSSLSFAIHSALASRMRLHKEAYRYFVRAAEIDLEDAMGNAANGVHMATQGGLWQAVVMGFAGVRASIGLADPRRWWTRREPGPACPLKGEHGAVRPSMGGFCVYPGFPANWRRVSIPFMWRGRQVRLEISGLQRC